MSAIVPYEIRQGDTYKALHAILTYKDSTGAIADRDLSAVTSVTFSLVNAATGETKVSSASATVDDAAGGEVSYAFSTGDVDEPGIYWGAFMVTENGKTDTYPVNPKHAPIWIHGNGKTAKEAYEEAL